MPDSSTPIPVNAHPTAETLTLEERRQRNAAMKKHRPDWQAGGRRHRDNLLKSDLTRPEHFALLAVLRDIERERGSARYLEIGVLAGGTMHFLIENTKAVEFTGIDLFEDWKPSDENTHISGTYQMADVQAALGDRARLIKGDFAELSQTPVGPFDFIFIDADHAYRAVKRDFELARPLLAPGGFVAFHNCSVHIPPDDLYIAADGGPWKLTQEIRRLPEFDLVVEVDRVRIFQWLTRGERA